MDVHQLTIAVAVWLIVGFLATLRLAYVGWSEGDDIRVYHVLLFIPLMAFGAMTAIIAIVWLWMDYSAIICAYIRNVFGTVVIKGRRRP
jgi:hypothetical protein